MIEVKFTFETEAELIAFVAGKMRQEVYVAAPVSNPPPPQAESHARKPGRPKKMPIEADTKVVPNAAPATAELVQPLDVANGDPLPASMMGGADISDLVTISDVEEPAPVETIDWTAERVRQEMKTFSEKFGIDPLRQAMLNAVGKAKFSDVPAADYAKLGEALRADQTKVA